MFFPSPFASYCVVTSFIFQTTADLEVPSLGRTSPGYLFRQEYLPQFDTGLISKTETQEMQYQVLVQVCLKLNNNNNNTMMMIIIIKNNIIIIIRTFPESFSPEKFILGNKFVNFKRSNLLRSRNMSTNHEIPLIY